MYEDNVYIVLSLREITLYQYTVMVESVWSSKTAADMHAKALNILHIDRAFYVDGPFTVKQNVSPSI